MVMKCFKALFIVFLLSLLSACGKPPSVSIDAKVQPLVDEFLEQAKKRDKNVRIIDLDIIFVTDVTKYTENGESANAACVKGNDFDRPTIIISKGFWDTTYEYSRKRTIFHELGHCVLGREHRNEMTTLDNVSAPASIMAAQFNNVSFFIMHYDYYMDELFSASLPNLH
jgi:hypothetical protein